MAKPPVDRHRSLGDWPGVPVRPRFDGIGNEIPLRPRLACLRLLSRSIALRDPCCLRIPIDVEKRVAVAPRELNR
jgi:hypothetical protein